RGRGAEAGMSKVVRQRDPLTKRAQTMLPRSPVGRVGPFGSSTQQRSLVAVTVGDPLLSKLSSTSMLNRAPGIFSHAENGADPSRAVAPPAALFRVFLGGL